MVTRTFTLAFTLASVGGCGGLNSVLEPTGLTGSAVPVALNQFSLDGSFRNTGLGGTGIMSGLGSGTLGASGYNFVPVGGLRLVGLTGVSDVYTIATTFAVNQGKRPVLYTKSLDFPASSLTKRRWGLHHRRRRRRDGYRRQPRRQL